MGKAGRKRKAGAREANGRLQRPTVERLNEMADADRRKVQATVLAQPHRGGRPASTSLVKNVHRWRDDQGKLVDTYEAWASDVYGAQGTDHPWAENPLGRVCLRNSLRQELYAAGARYAVTVSCWRRARGVPDFLPLDPPSGDDGSAPSEATIKRWRDEMIGIERALMRVGMGAFLAVRTLVLDLADIGIEQDLAAIEGLTAVAVETGTMRLGEGAYVKAS